MKKFILLLLLLSAAGFSLNTFFGTDRVFRIGSECDYVPNNWVEHTPSDTNVPIVGEDGSYAEGYDIQIAKIVAKELGAKLEVHKVKWDDLFYALNHGDIDAIFSGMLDTKPRKQFAAFSQPYDAFDNEYAIIVDRHSKYRNAWHIVEFLGAKLVAQKGTHLDDVIDQIKGVIHLPPVDSVTDSVKEVLEHKADGAVINYDTAQPYLRKHKDLRLRRFSKGNGFHLDFTGTCVGVRKNDTELLEEINRALHGISKWDRQKLMDRSITNALHHVSHVE